jgi:hypothetical protein
MSRGVASAGTPGLSSHNQKSLGRVAPAIKDMCIVEAERCDTEILMFVACRVSAVA